MHELAHQWFGDDLAPAEWSDVWLSEGHATWYEALYADRKFGVSMLDRLHTFYELGNQYRADFGPVALPSHSDFLNLFSDNVYNGGMLVLYALYQRVGEKTFYEIERKWAQRNRGESVSTDDFIAHAAKVARTAASCRSCASGSTGPRSHRCRAIRTGPRPRRRPSGRAHRRRASARGASRTPACSSASRCQARLPATGGAPRRT